MTPARLLAGASGYSFKEWKGTFYPEKIKPEDMLAVVFRAAADGRDQQHVLPDAEDRRCSRTGPRRRPQGFRFSIKASQRITHMARLKIGSGDRAARLSLQEPRRARRQARPRAVPVAAESQEGSAAARRRSSACCPPDHAPRSNSATTPGSRTMSTTRSRRAGAALCLSEREDNAPPPLVETAPWGYVRLRLENVFRRRSCAVGAHGSRRRRGAQIYRLFHARAHGAGVCARR